MTFDPWKASEIEKLLCSVNFKCPTEPSQLFFKQQCNRGSVPMWEANLLCPRLRPFDTGQYADGSDPGTAKLRSWQPHVIEKKRQQYCSSAFTLKRDGSLELVICSYYENKNSEKSKYNDSSFV